MDGNEVLGDELPLPNPNDSMAVSEANADLWQAPLLAAGDELVVDLAATDPFHGAPSYRVLTKTGDVVATSTFHGRTSVPNNTGTDLDLAIEVFADVEAFSSDTDTAKATPCLQRSIKGSFRNVVCPMRTRATIPYPRQRWWALGS